MKAGQWNREPWQPSYSPTGAGPLPVAPVSCEGEECGIEAHRESCRLRQNKLCLMTRQQVLDLYFMDARFRLIELAAFLDRVDCADGEADFRLDAFRQALHELEGTGPERARQVLLAFSDPSTAPIDKAQGKGATGAWPGSK